MEPEQPEQPQSSQTPHSSYNKKPLWQWIAVYLAAGIVIYGLIYYLFIAKKDTQNTNTPNTTNTNQESQSQPTSEEQAGESQADVILTNDGFTPQTVTVKKGGMVSWINESGTTATVHSAKHPTHEVYPPLNLGEFSNGESLTLVFDTPGTYNYHNHLNSSQFGTVIVQ